MLKILSKKNIDYKVVEIWDRKCKSKTTELRFCYADNLWAVYIIRFYYDSKLEIINLNHIYNARTRRNFYSPNIERELCYNFGFLPF